MPTFFVSSPLVSVTLWRWARDQGRTVEERTGDGFAGLSVGKKK
jgi:hypothetical protein